MGQSHQSGRVLLKRAEKVAVEKPRNDLKPG